MLKGKIVVILFVVSLAVSLLGFSILNWSGWIAVLDAVFFSTLLAYGSANVRSNFFIPTLNRADNQQAIAITFDDGPTREKTDKILDILKSKGVSSTFFCIGKNIEKETELISRMHSEGHLVGNHSYNHGPLFDLQSASTMYEELVKTNDVVFTILGKRMRLFRPPYGVTNPSLAKAVKKGNFDTIGWSLRSFDTVTKDKDILWKRISEKLRAGDVVLFHDFCDHTIELLPRFIDHVTKSGLKIVRLDALLKVTPYE